MSRVCLAGIFCRAGRELMAADLYGAGQPVQCRLCTRLEADDEVVDAEPFVRRDAWRWRATSPGCAVATVLSGDPDSRGERAGRSCDSSPVSAWRTARRRLGISFGPIRGVRDQAQQRLLLTPETARAEAGNRDQNRDRGSTPGGEFSSRTMFASSQVRMAEDARFELATGCPQHAFQHCWPAFAGVRHRP